VTSAASARKHLPGACLWEGWANCCRRCAGKYLNVSEKTFERHVETKCRTSTSRRPCGAGLAPSLMAGSRGSGGRMRGQPWELRHRPGRQHRSRLLRPRPRRPRNRTIDGYEMMKEKLKSARARSGLRKCAARGSPSPRKPPLRSCDRRGRRRRVRRAARAGGAAHREQYVARYEADLNLYVTPKSTPTSSPPRPQLGRRLWQPAWRYVDEITSALGVREAAAAQVERRAARLVDQHLTNTLRHFLRFCVQAGYIENEPELKRRRGAKAVQGAAAAARVRPRRARALLRGSTSTRRSVRPARLIRPGTAGRFYEVLHFSLLRRGEAVGADAALARLPRG
jgi:hypothetical protein